jgi:glycosyltransferase involved in cell wall biosynthesis
LVVGTNFKHKNRAYAIQAFLELVNRYAWPGHLVLAGPHVASGGSESEEEQARAQCPELNRRIHDIGAVSEAEKNWLLSNATLVLYPTLYEGFGLIPFEAAAHQTPVLTFRETALEEVLGDAVVYLESHDPRQGAETIWRLINDRAEMLREVACIQARAADFTWDGVAGTTWNFYQQILQLPPRIDLTQKQLLTAGGAPGLVHSMTRRWREWSRRLQLAIHVVQTQGWAALRKEVRQYIQWRRAQF